MYESIFHGSWTIDHSFCFCFIRHSAFGVRHFFFRASNLEFRVFSASNQPYENNSSFNLADTLPALGKISASKAIFIGIAGTFFAPNVATGASK